MGLIVLSFMGEVYESALFAFLNANAISEKMLWKARKTIYISSNEVLANNLRTTIFPRQFSTD